MGIFGQELGSEIASGFEKIVDNKLKHSDKGEQIGRVARKNAGRYSSFERGIVKPPKGYKTSYICSERWIGYT